MRLLLSSLALPLAVLLLSASSAAQPPAEPAEADATPQPQPVSFFGQVRPIFQQHCYGCHQPAKRGGEYVMSQFAALLEGGESGEKAVVAGKPEESYLVAQITPQDGQAEMPQERPPLSADQIALITRWIREGAQDDSPASTRPNYTAENPPKYVAPPVVTALEYSPDGSLLAISGYHEVVLRKTDDYEVAARLVGLSERIQSLDFSPDGKRLLVAGGSPGRFGELQIWDVAQRSLSSTVTVGYDTLYGASFSPDGKLAAFGCPDNTVRAVDAETGEQVLFNGAHNDWVLDTVFSTQGDHLVTVSRDMSMKLINVPTQRFIDNITSITPGALKGGLHVVDRHPTKDELLCGGADGVPKVYRMVREKARKIGDDFNLIRAFGALPGRVFDVEFSADGSRVLAGSSLDGGGEVAVFATDDAKEVMRQQLPSGIYAVAFHPQAETVAAGGFDGRIRVLETASGKTLHEFYPVALEPQTAGK